MSTVVREGVLVTISPEHDLVAATVPGFKHEVVNLLHEGPLELRLDLDGTKKMDIVGMGMVIAMHNSMQKIGGHFSLVNIPENMMKMFRSMRLDQHLNMRA